MKPKRYDSLNLIDLEMWNKVTLIKLLWNISDKTEGMMDSYVLYLKKTRYYGVPGE